MIPSSSTPPKAAAASSLAVVVAPPRPFYSRPDHHHHPPARVDTLFLTLPPHAIRSIFLFAFGECVREKCEQPYRDGGMWSVSSVVHLRAAMKILSLISRAFHDMVHQTKELYLPEERRWSRGKFHLPLLMVAGIPSLTDHRLSPLITNLQRGPRPVLVTIKAIDLCATAITASSVIAILQCCPSLERLDVGECEALNVVELAEKLEEEVAPETLLVGHLRVMEVCGSGKDSHWIGYSQRQPVSQSRGPYGTDTTRRSYEITGGSGSITRDFIKRQTRDSNLMQKLGSHPFLRWAIKTIEATIHSRQQPSPVFSMNTNICEHCYTSFAESLCHDGKAKLIERGDWFQRRQCPPEASCSCCQSMSAHCTKKDDMDRLLREYGKHTCRSCGLSLYLCVECASYVFHYCAEDHCEACYCVACDGGINAMAALEAYRRGDGAAWERLKAMGTLHFKLGTCAYEGAGRCKMPDDWKVVCKGTNPDCKMFDTSCKRCGRWQCCKCMEDVPLDCSKCNQRACPSCTTTSYCDSCDESFCQRCDRLRRFDICPPIEPWNSQMEGTDLRLDHCTSCWKELHGAAAVSSLEG